MRHLVFSDLHGDTDGWKRLQRRSEFAAAHKICLGDVANAADYDVGFYREVRAATDVLVLGNHEAVLAGLCEPNVFNTKYQLGLPEACKQFAAAQPALIQELEALPRHAELPGAAFTHASFQTEAPWHHLRYIEDLAAEAPHLPAHLNFYGHGHIPFIAWLQDGLWFYERQLYGRTFRLDPKLPYIINPGSLLGSREMRWLEKTALIFDDQAQTVQFFNLNQDQS